MRLRVSCENQPMPSSRPGKSNRVLTNIRKISLLSGAKLTKHFQWAGQPSFFTFAAMQKKFLENLGLLLLANLLIKPFWILGIDRNVQNLVGHQEYGFYTAVLNLSFLLNILLDFGITSFNTRNIAQNEHLLSKHLSGIVLLRFVLAVFYMIVLLSVGAIIGYDKQQMSILVLVGINQFLLSFLLYLRSNISGLLMFKAESLLSVLDRVVMIIIIGIMLVVDSLRVKFRIEWFIYVQTLAYLISNAVAAALLLRKSRIKRLNWNPLFFCLILRKSLPFALLAILMATYNRIDPVLIERLLPEPIGDHETGIYATAFRLLDALNMIPYLFSILLLPLFASKLKQKVDVVSLVKTSFSLLFAFSVLVASTALIYSRPMMSMLYPQDVFESSLDFIYRLQASSFIFTILMFGFIAISTTYVFGTLLTANGNLVYLNLTAAAGVLINLSLNFWLIPHMRASGAAIASLTSQTFTALVQVWLALHILKLNIEKNYLVRLLLYLLFIALSSLLVYGLFRDDLIMGIILFWIIGGLVAILLKLINIQELWEIFTSKSA
jgi:O-antigen/teichoic acid export membrane protein